MNQKLNPDTLLKAMLNDMEHQPEVFQPTPFWDAGSKEILTGLKREGFENFRRLKSARRFFVPSYGPPGNLLTAAQVEELEATLLGHAPKGSKAHATLMQFLNGDAWALADYRVYLAGDRPEIEPNLASVSESTTGNPPDGHFFEGRRYSRSLLNYLHGLVFLKQQLGNANIRRVLEIGGGYGTLGEILFQASGAYSYIDVDIPPTSAIASYYLSQLPGLNLLDYTQTRNLPSIVMPKAGQQMVLCPWQLPALVGEVDLLWNYISFQEMEPDVVKFYLQQGNRLNARYVLLRNLREGKQKRTTANSIGVNQPILGSDYDSFLPDYTLLATNVFPYGFKTVDGFHSELRLYARR